MRNSNYSTMDPEVELDLHGFSVIQAKHELDELLNSEQFSCVRVIVGKGKNSPEGPILPIFVKNYLNERGFRYTHAPKNEGGEGAIDVFL